MRSTAMRVSQPGPRGQANAAPWRRWLLLEAVSVRLITLLAVSSRVPRSMPLSYTQFVADVRAGTVRAVAIGPAGPVNGQLGGGQSFCSILPVEPGWIVP